MNKKLYLVLLAIILCITCFSVKSLAETAEELRSVSDLREQRKDLQDKISENTLHLDELEGQISDLMMEIQDLNDRIFKYEVEIAVLDGEIGELNDKISVVQEKFDEVEETYNERKEILANRIIAQYEEGDVVYLDFLLNSKGLVDFISNYYVIGEIIEYDKELIQTCEKQKQEIAVIKEELDSYKAELKEKKDEQEKSAIVLSNVKVIKDNQVANLTEEEMDLQSQIDEYQEETRKIEVELLMILTRNLGGDYTGGALAWPVPGYMSITSEYGMRIHPISGIYKMHTGIDVAAPKGAYFIAANDGTVVKSVYSSSYGNMVVIDHGGGLSTLYAHGSERLVEEGDQVVKGEPVLIVGSTGISTGPHAHFEVRVNGSWTEPLEYIFGRSDE